MDFNGLRFHQKLIDGTFLILSIKLQQLKSLKLTQIIFSGKFLFCRFLSKRGPKLVKNNVVKSNKIVKINACNACNFYDFFPMKLQQHKGLKLTQTIFFCIKSLTVFSPKRMTHKEFFLSWGLWTNRGQNRPKIRLFDFP